MESDKASSSGYCQTCNTTHHIYPGAALAYCDQLMSTLEESKHIDFASSTSDPKLSTDYLFGSARGQMFGVMTCRHPDGTVGTIKAFSGQYDGIWQVNGWVPPLFNIQKMDALCRNVEKNIKSLGREIEAFEHDSSKRNQLRQDRRLLSQNLMRKIHTLYLLPNFRGETAALTDVFRGKGRGIPTGVGDCCAPKLLGYAASNNLTPLGVAEFFWGRTNRSKSKSHKNFYPACLEKCQPILGFMLCGL
nr:hypothetical protein [Desulfobulbaceae bacterium]